MTTQFQTTSYSVSDENDSEHALLRRTQAYLRCRARRIEPSAPLVEAWEKFYRRYDPMIRSVIQKSGLGAMEMSDCVQDVWASLVTRLADFAFDPGRGRLASWLYTVTRNKVVDIIRRRHAVTPLNNHNSASLMDSSADPVVQTEHRWHRDVIREALARLQSQISGRSFHTLYLRLVEDRPVSAVADIVGLSPTQVRLSCHRAKRRLRQLCHELLQRGEGDLAAEPERNL